MIEILSERFGLTVCFQVKANTGMLQPVEFERPYNQKLELATV
jgi:hypothetical protein